MYALVYVLFVVLAFARLIVIAYAAHEFVHVAVVALPSVVRLELLAISGVTLDLVMRKEFIAYRAGYVIGGGGYVDGLLLAVPYIGLLRRRQTHTHIHTRE